MILAHGDGILRGDHVPEPITAQDDVLVLLGVDGVHAGVGLGGHHELPTVEVVAPEIPWQSTKWVGIVTQHMRNLTRGKERKMFLPKKSITISLEASAGT